MPEATEVPIPISKSESESKLAIPEQAQGFNTDVAKEIAIKKFDDTVIALSDQIDGSSQLTQKQKKELRNLLDIVQAEVGEKLEDILRQLGATREHACVDIGSCIAKLMDNLTAPLAYKVDTPRKMQHEIDMALARAGLELRRVQSAMTEVQITNFREEAQSWQIVEAQPEELQSVIQSTKSSPVVETKPTNPPPLPNSVTAIEPPPPKSFFPDDSFLATSYSPDVEAEAARAADNAKWNPKIEQQRQELVNKLYGLSKFSDKVLPPDSIDGLRRAMGDFFTGLRASTLPGEERIRIAREWPRQVIASLISDLQYISDNPKKNNSRYQKNIISKILSTLSIVAAPFSGGVSLGMLGASGVVGRIESSLSNKSSEKPENVAEAFSTAENKIEMLGVDILKAEDSFQKKSTPRVREVDKKPKIPSQMKIAENKP